MALMLGCVLCMHCGQLTWQPPPSVISCAFMREGTPEPSPCTERAPAIACVSNQIVSKCTGAGFRHIGAAQQGFAPPPPPGRGLSPWYQPSNSSMRMLKAQLAHLVQILQQQKLGDWRGYLQGKVPGVKQFDPHKQSEEVLRGFIEGVLNLGGADGQWERQVMQRSAALPRQCTLVRRAIKWLQRKDKEHRLKATSAPHAPNRPRGSTHTATASTVDAWQLVHATRQHPKYSSQYDFPSYLPGWTRAKRRAVQSGAQPPRLLAIDCEMIATETDPRHLVALSVVDEQGKLVYSNRVKPREAVVDYNTAITGLTEADLQDVDTTRSDVRREVKALLLDSWRKDGQLTILVGHGVYNDLNALRLDYQPVIDTALIFSYRSLPGCTPALRDLHRIVFGSDMSVRGAGRHDSAEDAHAAMKLVQHELAQQQRTPPLPAPEIRADKEQLRKLLVHGIAPSVSESQLLGLFKPLLASPRSGPASNDESGSGGNSGTDSDSDSSDSSGDSKMRDADVQINASSKPVADKGNKKQPTITQMPRFESEPGIKQQRATLVFKHAGEANDAFKGLLGKAGKDTMGRPTKMVTLDKGVSVTVRKMAGHNGFQFSQSDKVVESAGGKGGKAGASKKRARRGLRSKTAPSPKKKLKSAAA